MPNMRFIKSIITIVILLTFSFSVFAQDPLAGRDLSTIKVDALSDNQISAIQQKLKQSGLTIDQVESQAIAKGMSPEEFSKLKDRLNGITGIVMAKSVKRGNINLQTNAESTTNIKDSAVENINRGVNKLVYGSELFTTSSSNANKYNLTTIAQMYSTSQ
jgi:nucleoside diphosphate kinase